MHVVLPLYLITAFYILTPIFFLFSFVQCQCFNIGSLQWRFDKCFLLFRSLFTFVVNANIFHAFQSLASSAVVFFYLFSRIDLVAIFFPVCSSLTVFAFILLIRSLHWRWDFFYCRYNAVKYLMKVLFSHRSPSYLSSVSSFPISNQFDVLILLFDRLQVDWLPSWLMCAVRLASRVLQHNRTMRCERCRAASCIRPHMTLIISYDGIILWWW